MFTGAAQCLRTAAPRLPLCGLLTRRGPHGGAGRLQARLQARRHFGASRPAAAKVLPPHKPRERVEIPGLEMVTYADRMHYVPGLAKPVNPPWVRDYKDPRYYKSPPAHQMALFREKPCFVYHQRTSALEGVRQALWLTKTRLTPGLPPPLLSPTERPADRIPDQDERVQNAIKHARFWDTTKERPRQEKYSNTLLLNLLHLCASLQSSLPRLGRRLLCEKYSLGATWTRGEDLFQIRGQSGLLQTCMDPLPVVSGDQEVEDTAEHVLESLSPVEPTIDLQQVTVYEEQRSCTGFRGVHPYPHAHTLYFLDGGDPKSSLRPQQFKAKMLMFAFGNALTRAHTLYGSQPQRVLDRPITVQAVGTNGRIFQFLVFQLNTTDLSGDDGIKNQVWLDEDVELYDFAKVRPLIKKKKVKVPAGLAGYRPEVFKKFLALFLHGAV